MVSRKGSGKPAPTVDEYLASIPRDARIALLRLRKTIQAAAPGATEVIWYGIPTFKLDRMLVSYAAFREHCSFFPLSSRLLEKLRREVVHFDSSKGTIRFPFNKPLPASLVRKIVAARIKQNKMRGPGKSALKNNGIGPNAVALLKKGLQWNGLSFAPVGRSRKNE